MLEELGRIEVGQAPDRAMEYLTEALELVTGPGPPRRPLPCRSVMCWPQAGRFAPAVDVLAQSIADLGAADAQLRAELESTLIDTGRWDPACHRTADRLLDDLRARADRGEQIAATLARQPGHPA